MTSIEIRTLYKTFYMGEQEVHAVQGVDLTIEDGSFTVIMGPSGSGKSTLLYMVGGLEIPSAGSILVDGIAIEKMDGKALAEYRKKKVGFVFQAFYLIPSMIALENVAFPMRFAGVSANQRRERARNLLEQVGLADRVKHLPTEMSGGQQQRVAIARALANNPSLVLADEPTGNLDRKIGAEIVQLLARLNREGRTVVIVTHDPSMISVASQVVYMLDGRTVSEAEYMENVSFIKPTEHEMQKVMEG
jgi:putative ABC transport system ATP-binding protein